MDVFQGAGGTLQVHDFNPGEENGLFWTTPVQKSAVEADFARGIASFSLRNFEIDDYGNVVNALTGGKEIATAQLSIDIRWSGTMSRETFSQPAYATPFTVHVAHTGATMSWTAVENGGTIVGHQSTTPDFAIIAMENNGVFF